MFEPVHGSAPDIAGRNIANPIGTIWSAALMLDHFGSPQAARAVEDAIEAVCESGRETPDFGGKASSRRWGKQSLTLCNFNFQPPTSNCQLQLPRRLSDAPWELAIQ